MRKICELSMRFAQHECNLTPACLLGSEIFRGVEEQLCAPTVLH